MKKIMLLLLVFSGNIPSVISQNQTDTSEKKIYDFVQMMIRKEHLDLRLNIIKEPEIQISNRFTDSELLQKLLLQKDTKVSTKIEDVLTNSSNMNRCLDENDVTEMLAQKDGLKTFKWDNQHLGFDSLNSRANYTISVPLFSSDGQKVLVRYEKNCPGEKCGFGKTLLFKKENNEWSVQLLEIWYH